LIHIKRQNNYSTKVAQLPNFRLCNARSLPSKVDELDITKQTMLIDVAVITETWLHDTHDCHLINISNFVLNRKDRINGRGGGVCAYVSSSIPCKRRFDLECPLFECMWVWLRPQRLPRPLAGIMNGVVYHPPDKSTQE
jgi:hypothetical protein